MDPPGREKTAIILMGLTGSGKSTFIASLTGAKDRVGTSLESCTRKAEAIYYGTDPTDHNRDLYLIDTPGFDDTTRSDLDIVREIGVALQVCKKLNILVYGVVYLHRIIDPRVSGATIKSLRILEHICGTKSYRDVTLVTTMWDRLEFTEGGSRIGDDRVHALVSKNEFWGSLIEGGAKISSHSAPREIVERLVLESSHVPLQMQLELGSDTTSLPLEKTSVGRYLERDINTVRKQYESELTALHDDLMEAMEDKDEKLQKLILKEKRTREDLLKQIKAQLWELQMETPPPRRKEGDIITSDGDQTGNFAQHDSGRLYAQQKQAKTPAQSYTSGFDDGVQKEPITDTSARFLNGEFEAVRQKSFRSSMRGHEIEQTRGSFQGNSKRPQSFAAGQEFMPSEDRRQTNIRDSQSPTIGFDLRQRGDSDPLRIDRFQSLAGEQGFNPGGNRHQSNMNDRQSPTIGIDHRQRGYSDQSIIDSYQSLSMRDNPPPRGTHNRR